jgi:GxxExxY protein
MTFIHYEITDKILEACFEVAKELGSGFLESVYQNALVIALEQKGLEITTEHPVSVIFRGKSVGNFFADILVEEKIILEIKAVSALTPQHKAQVINYLKATGIEVGLLVNFGKPKLEYYRLHK